MDIKVIPQTESLRRRLHTQEIGSKTIS